MIDPSPTSSVPFDSCSVFFVGSLFLLRADLADETAVLEDRDDEAFHVLMALTRSRQVPVSVFVVAERCCDVGKERM